MKYLNSKHNYLSLILFLWLFVGTESRACSIIYYVDPHTGKIYVANNEDYWYDVKAHIQIEPATKKEFARLWYGWDGFAQGGVNEHGLFFDAAVTPKQDIPEGFNNPDGRNVGDEILALCTTVEEAVRFLENEKIAVSQGHMMLGDGEGNAVVVEWVDGEVRVIKMSGNYLIVTNFLLSEIDADQIQCPRYKSMDERARELLAKGEEADLRSVGNIIGGAVQVPREDAEGRVGGTLYSSFIDISEKQLILVPRLDNNKLIRLDLFDEFKKGRKRKIKLK